MMAANGAARRRSATAGGARSAPAHTTAERRGAGSPVARGGAPGSRPLAWGGGQQAG
jgi:hypothetical protein